MNSAKHFINRVSAGGGSAYPTAGLVSYYKLDANSNDSFGSNNGIDTSVTYVAGKVGNAGSFNGSSSKINLNLSSITGTTASINFWVKCAYHIPSIAGNTGLMSITSNESLKSHYSWLDGDIYLNILTSTRKNIGGGIVTDRTVWHMCTITADSFANIWKFYQNGTLVTTSTVGSFTFQADATLGLSTFGDGVFLNGMLDEVSIHNTILSQTDIDTIYNGGVGITL